MKRQITGWKNIFAKYTLNKELLSKLHKDLLKCNNTKNKQIKKQAKDLNKHLLKDIQMANKHMKISPISYFISQMKIKTVASYHYISAGMAKIWNTINSKSWQGYSNGKSHTLLVRLKILIIHMLLLFYFKQSSLPFFLRKNGSKIVTNFPFISCEPSFPSDIICVQPKRHPFHPQPKSTFLSTRSSMSNTQERQYAWSNQLLLEPLFLLFHISIWFNCHYAQNPHLT